MGATKTRPQVHGNPLGATKTSPPPYAREPIGSDHKLDPKCTGTHQERRKVGVSEGEDTGKDQTPSAREPIGSDKDAPPLCTGTHWERQILDPKCTGTHQERCNVGVSEGGDTGQPNYSERTQNKSVEFAKVGRRGASAATLHRLGISRTQNQSVQFARVWFLS